MQGANKNFKRYSTPVRILVALLCLFVMTIPATVGTLFMLFPFTVLLPLSIATYQSITNFWISTWLVLPPILNQVFFGTKLRVFGAPGLTLKFPAGVPECGWNLFIMNHRTRLDWYYIWLVFLHANNPMQMAQMFKIVLKSSLSKLPGFGWAMQMARFLFLNRAWDKDKAHMDTYVSMIVNHAVPHSILIFPEGTDYEPKSLKSSHSFAKKNNLPLYSHVLHPRTTGTVHLMQQLIKGKSLEQVVNVTVFYPDFIPSNELSLIFGKVPAEVWYFVEIIPLKQIPGTSSTEPSEQAAEQLGEWLKEIWQEKEQILTAVLEGRKEQQGNLFTGEEENSIGRMREKFVEQKLGPQLITLNYGIFVWWSFFSCFSLYVLFVSRVVQLLGLTVVSIMAFVNWKYGGWDYLEMELFNKHN